MAIRFSGPHSPNAQPGKGSGIAEPKPHPMRRRTRYIVYASLPFLFGAFGQAPEFMALDLAAFGAMAGSMFLTRQGLDAQVAYEARPAARRPALPRKLLGALTAGAGLAMGSYDPGALAGAGIIGAAGVALHTLAFGLDPWRNKGVAGVDDFQQERAQRIIDEAEEYLATMRDAVLRLKDRRIQERVDTFSASVQRLFQQIMRDPRDISSLRKYLGVYLMGARDATVKFVALYEDTGDRKVLADWQSLLTDLEAGFAQQLARAQDAGRTDLDIEIEVLRDRLARDGVRTAEDPIAEDVARHPDGARALPNLRSQTVDQLLARAREAEGVKRP